jgi:hypothetical protein
MPRLSLKPDSSFFRKIAIGAVGTRAICHDLEQHGHDVQELERGSLDTKIWKEVKRKRVRIPDLICVKCGLRVESRAKVAAKLTMSHSDDEERAWDYGMVDADVVAFPVCDVADEAYWSAGQLAQQVSYWHERSWVRWNAKPFINYIRIKEFRAAPFLKERPKGVTEGSETIISWPSIFSTVNGHVDLIEDHRIVIKPLSGSRRSWRFRGGVQPVVQRGQQVFENQLLASTVKPELPVTCSAVISDEYMGMLISSRERTQRFTGVKLARLNRHAVHAAAIRDLEADDEEDVYIRLEAAAYLVSVMGEAAASVFTPYLESTDEQRQLEAVIALGESRANDAVALLSALLADTDQPYFMRSAAAWCLGQIGDTEAAKQLIQSFRDVNANIRDEALDGITSIGNDATAILLAGITEVDQSIAAGCAEALRRRSLPKEAIEEAVRQLRGPQTSPWTVWLLGNLPKDEVAPLIAKLQDKSPELHFALTLLWAFTESWIARRWELLPKAVYPNE